MLNHQNSRDSFDPRIILHLCKRSSVFHLRGKLQKYEPHYFGVKAKLMNSNAFRMNQNPISRSSSVIPRPNI